MTKRHHKLVPLIATALFTTIALEASVFSQAAYSTSMTTTPLIFDDDGSQDGFAALAYLLANPKFDLQAITMSHGVARPENEGFQTGLKQLLGRLDATDIPVGIGSALPLSGDNAFPGFVRNDADNFFAPFVNLPSTVPDIEFTTAAELIVETVNNSPEPVAIMSTGSLTNIAEAIRIDPSIIDNISVVQTMGGAVFTPGNLGITPEPPFSTNDVAEFNIWVDPLAAAEVFEAGERGLNIQMMPLDGTDRVEFTRDDYQAWLDFGTPESTVAAEFLDFSLVVVGNDVNPNPLWDMVAAINLSEADFSTEVPLHIEVDVDSPPEDTQGQTFAVEGLPPNASVSLDASFEDLPFNASELFSSLETPTSTAVSEPTSLLALLMLGGFGIGITTKRSKGNLLCGDRNKNN
ncbi:Nucleoside hydrolase [Hyella patelloides LEGE 07179]|uniref:Nucleoside hydrolase n=1 Tax=Hyella patelloides LEGE 07179 TaxID=945734 RepID=A0A563VW05_9CYAN|nr:nucleoside hydrolase [Hyella patelloides]VEP15600.1 Nucleoside hydrolase [Hyella patelloides LEGE 07179]